MWTAGMGNDENALPPTGAPPVPIQSTPSAPNDCLPDRKTLGQWTVQSQFKKPLGRAFITPK